MKEAIVRGRYSQQITIRIGDIIKPYMVQYQTDYTSAWTGGETSGKIISIHVNNLWRGYNIVIQYKNYKANFITEGQSWHREFRVLKRAK